MKIVLWTDCRQNLQTVHILASNPEPKWYQSAAMSTQKNAPKNNPEGILLMFYKFLN